MIPFNFVGPGFNIEGLHSTISNIGSEARCKLGFALLKVLQSLAQFFFTAQRLFTKTLE